jgi:hypothetical protein
MKYAQLIESIQPKESIMKDMEITFTSGLTNNLEEIIQRKLEKGTIEKTPFEKEMEKQARKRREKRQQLKEKFAKIEEEKLQLLAESKKQNKKKFKSDEKTKNELSLLLMDPLNDKTQTQTTESEPPSKKRHKKTSDLKDEETTINALSKDPRFNKLFVDTRYARDPSSSKFTSSTANAMIIAEKDRRKSQTTESKEPEPKTQSSTTISPTLQFSISRIKKNLKK